MMKIDMNNGQDWQGFSKILEVMSFVEEVEDSSLEDVRDTAGERDRTLAPHRPVSGQIERQRQVAFGAQARRHAVPGMARASEAVQQDDPLRHIAIVDS